MLIDSKPWPVWEPATLSLSSTPFLQPFLLKKLYFSNPFVGMLYLHKVMGTRYATYGGVQIEWCRGLRVKCKAKDRRATVWLMRRTATTGARPRRAPASKTKMNQGLCARGGPHRVLRSVVGSEASLDKWSSKADVGGLWLSLLEALLSFDRECESA